MVDGHGPGAAAFANSLSSRGVERRTAWLAATAAALPLSGRAPEVMRVSGPDRHRAGELGGDALPHDHRAREPQQRYHGGVVRRTVTLVDLRTDAPLPRQRHWPPT